MMQKEMLVIISVHTDMHSTPNIHLNKKAETKSSEISCLSIDLALYNPH